MVLDVALEMGVTISGRYATSAMKKSGFYMFINVFVILRMVLKLGSSNNGSAHGQLSSAQ